MFFAIASPCFAQAAKQQLFERVFGTAANLDPATVAKVKALKPGEQLLLDTNGDGKPDECWFIDASPRHQQKAQPLLVRAIDEDGDMGRDGGPDLDSDLYIADWSADGTVDAVIDYQDNDGDNDVDEMGIYYFSPKEKALDGKPALRCWWGSDDGDDNQLWYDVNYTYDQALCQYHSHFSGDETFVAFALGADSKEWQPCWEDPFLFYDPDRDSCSEVALRISMKGDQIECLRYSFDADDDAYGRRTHDYDFSITALAPGSDWLVGSSSPRLTLPENVSARTKLRGIPTGRFLARDKAQKFCTTSKWIWALMAWDEMNANTEADVQHDPHERWEGVIAHGSADFPQVGGPSCSELNKRYELTDEPYVPLKLYYEPADRRLHMYRGRRAWLKIDFDFDGKADAGYTWIDEDRDNVYDRRQIDLDGDGKMDFDWHTPANKQTQKQIDLDFKSISTFYKQVLADDLADSQYFIQVAKAALAARQVPAEPAETYFLTQLEKWMPAAGLGTWMRRSPGGARFYIDFLRDRLLLALKKQIGDRPAWAGIESRYAAGDFRGSAERIIRELQVAISPGADMPFRDFTRRVPLHLDNSGSPQREGWPVCISAKELQAIAKDFNPENCAVVAADRWLDWRQVPHQIDELDAEAGKELSFLADLPADASAVWYIYYSPDGKSPTTFPARTGSAEDWVPPNIGWESGRIAYRTYYGQFDFFGKKVDQLVYGDMGHKSYHSEVEWGIDALNTYATSGCGGLTLYVGGQTYRVQNPINKGNVKFEKRQISKGPIRATIELTASNIVPEHPDWAVRLRALIYAGRQESEIRAAVVGPKEEVVLATGFTKLDHEKLFAEPDLACFGLWGSQNTGIGEIGMSVIGPRAVCQGGEDLPEEHRWKWKTNHGRLRYWILADWRRGRQYPVAPTIDNWHQEVKDLGKLLLKDVALKIEHPEKVR